MDQASKVRFAISLDGFGKAGPKTTDIKGHDAPDSAASKQEDSDDDTDNIKKNISTYLLDYADLIGQLNPEDKIMVTEKPRATIQFLRQEQGFDEIGEVWRSGWNATIIKADLNAYKSGDISREEALERISFTKNEPTSEVARDVILLVDIMERLYAPDISTTYYLQRKTSLERLNNFGVVYHFDFYSSIKINEDDFDMPTLGLNGLTQIERDQKVKKLYSQFLTDIKQQFITYGKTVKSLQPEETVMFRIKLTACKDCNIPSTLEISAKSKDFRDFETGGISEKQMLNLLTISEKQGGE